MNKLLTLTFLVFSTALFAQKSERDSLLHICVEKGDLAYIEHGKSIISLCNSSSDTSIVNSIVDGILRLVESCTASRKTATR